jgi:hypothetical protein
MFIAALHIKTRDITSVSSLNSLLSQYWNASHFLQFLCMGAQNVRFAPVVPWAKASPAYS